MRIDEVEMLYFSPTGGTKKVVELLARPLGALGSGVDLTRRDDTYDRIFSPGELVVLGVPSYGGRVPAAAVERIGHLRGAGTLAVLVVAFGNRAYDDTLRELYALALAQGFVVIGMVAAVTAHSLIPQYGAGRPNREDQRELGEYARRIREKLERCPDAACAQLPPDPNAEQPLRNYAGSSLKPLTDIRCQGCGKCATECPVGAINRDRPRETDCERCISCMRCIKRCPKKARHLNWLMQFVATQKLRPGCKTPKSNELHL